MNESRNGLLLVLQGFLLGVVVTLLAVEIVSEPGTGMRGAALIGTGAALLAQVGIVVAVRITRRPSGMAGHRRRGPV